MNFQQVKKKAEELQKKMKEFQDKMDSIEVTGSSGAGAVKVISSGKGELKKVKIDPKIVDHSNIEILEDLIVAASNNAKKNAEHQSNEEMQKLGIPSNLMGGGIF